MSRPPYRTEEERNGTLADLSAQFAKANSDQQRWLREEVKGLRKLLVMVIRQQGGEVFVSERQRMMARFDDDIECIEDPENRGFRLRVR